MRSARKKEEEKMLHQRNLEKITNTSHAFFQPVAMK